MASVAERLVADCSVVVKWKLPGEPHAAEADEVSLDWQHRAIELCAPSLLTCEVVSTFLRACRRRRISAAEATAFIQDLLVLPFAIHDVTPALALRAFEIALRHNQSAYDCCYVALAEQQGIEFWTGDLRLHNALHGPFPFVRWIGDYQRKRP